MEQAEDFVQSHMQLYDHCRSWCSGYVPLKDRQGSLALQKVGNGLLQLDLQDLVNFCNSAIIYTQHLLVFYKIVREKRIPCLAATN